MQEAPANLTLAEAVHAGTEAAWHTLPLVRRAFLYGIGSLAVLGILFWGKAEASSVTTSKNDTAAALERQILLVKAAAKSSQTAVKFAELGLQKLNSQETELAAIYLEAAGTKDPKYRDANVYAGYTELALADGLWKVDRDTAVARTKRALEYLHVAEVADPIHGYTFQLLAVAYSNLGQEELAKDAKLKAEKFTESAAVTPEVTAPQAQ